MADNGLHKLSVTRNAEKRTTPRTTVSLPVFIEAGGRQHSARLHNLSHFGAMIEASVPLQPGSRIRFNCGTIAANAVVIWERMPHLGVRFSEAVDTTDVAHQVSRSLAAASRRERRRNETADTRSLLLAVTKRSATASGA